MKWLLVIVKFLFVGALFIVSNNHLYLSNPHDFEIFKQYYYVWLGNVFDYGKGITSYVVQSQWLPS
ncbi:MAG: hypothetical protein AABX48_04875 [Nanoarchaeota archaeon]